MDARGDDGATGNMGRKSQGKRGSAAVTRSAISYMFVVLEVNVNTIVGLGYSSNGGRGTAGTTGMSAEADNATNMY